MKVVLKKILCAFSWTCFAVMVAASISAVLSTALGVGAIVVSWFTDMSSVILFYAKTFFSSVGVITFISIIFSIYEYAQNVYQDRKMKNE